MSLFCNWIWSNTYNVWREYKENINVTEQKQIIIKANFPQHFCKKRKKSNVRSEQSLCLSPMPHCWNSQHAKKRQNRQDKIYLESARSTTCNISSNELLNRLLYKINKYKQLHVQVNKYEYYQIINLKAVINRKVITRSRLRLTTPSEHLVPKWHCMNVDATSSRSIDVHTTSILHHVPAR